MTHQILKIALNDGGRSKSRRPKQRNDCTVKATAIAFGLPYDTAFDMMQINGRDNNKGIHYVTFLRQYPEYCQRIPALREGMSVADWMLELEDWNGRYIVLVDRHVFVVVDGVIHDTYQCNAYNTVYSVWKVLKKMTSLDMLADAL